MVNIGERYLTKKLRRMLPNWCLSEHKSLCKCPALCGVLHSSIIKSHSPKRWFSIYLVFLDFPNSAENKVPDLEFLSRDTVKTTGQGFWNKGDFQFKNSEGMGIIDICGLLTIAWKRYAETNCLNVTRKIAGVVWSWHKWISWFLLKT